MIEPSAPSRFTIARGMIWIVVLAILFALPSGVCALGLVVLTTWGIGTTIYHQLTRRTVLPSTPRRISAIFIRVAMILDVSSWLAIVFIFQFRAGMETTFEIVLLASILGHIAFVLAFFVIALSDDSTRPGEFSAMALMLSTLPFVLALIVNLYVLLEWLKKGGP